MSNSRIRVSAVLGNMGRYVTAGAGIGTACAAVLAAVEVVVFDGPLISLYGEPFLRIFWTYLAFGFAMGGVAAALAGFVDAVLVGGDDSNRVVAVSVAVDGSIFTLLFLLRDAEIQGVTGIPQALMVACATSIVFWVTAAMALSRMVSPARRWLRYGGATRGLALVSTGVLFVVTVLAGRSGVPAARTHDARKPNIVLICIDNLRPDHLGAYGYWRETSPSIDAMASQGTRFANAYSHASDSHAAVASMFTGVYPAYHGAGATRDALRPLSEASTTIAEILQDAGYTTVGLMANVFLMEPFGLAQGFDRTVAFGTAHYALSVYRVLVALRVLPASTRVVGMDPDAAEVTDAALTWSSALEDRPSFLFVDYADLREPYDPPDDEFARFDRRTSSLSRYDVFMMASSLVERNAVPIPLRPGELHRLIDLYDASIAHVDREVGRLLDGLDDDTIVLLTSDHGTEFMEHGSVFTNNATNEELARVPLVIRQPDATAGKVVDGLARHIDLASTIAADAGIAFSGEGRPLPVSPDARGDSVAVVSVSEGSGAVALNTPGWKILRVDSTQAYYLFKLNEDPDGVRDVSASYPARLSQLKEWLDTYIVSSGRRNATGVAMAEHENH